VLLTARADDKLESNPAGARDDALQALKLSADFVPAALIAAKALFREGGIRKAATILEQTWKAGPHPEIGRVYVRARSGDSTLDRLKRAERLEGMRPNNVESLLVVAQAALDAREFSKARAKAEAAARIEPREAAFLLLADIEEAETGDQGRVRHWLAQALKAPRDPAWVADGFVSDKWLPVSPVTGRLDAFEWKAPFGQLEGPVEEGSTASIETALKTLPPLRETRPESVVNDHRIIELERAATIAEAVRPATSAPTPAKTAEPSASRPVPATSEPKPFFGGLPDDPGVRDPKVEPEPKTRLRLF
jgi:HemY protein